MNGRRYPKNPSLWDKPLIDKSTLKHFKRACTQLAISNAQSSMRAKFRKAVEEFEKELEQYNVDMTANVDVNISYVRRAVND